jgi:hypothetical protein
MADKFDGPRDWFEDDRVLAGEELPHLPGLPASFGHALSLVCGLAFALVWTFESIATLDSRRGFDNYSSFGANMWTLFLVMGATFIVFKLSRPMMKSLSYVLSGGGALYILLTHSF